MTQIKCADELGEAEELLKNVKHNIMFRPKTTEKLIQRDLARLKAIVDKADLLFNPKSNSEQLPQLNKPDVIRRIGVCYVAQNIMDDDDLKVFMDKAQCTTYCTTINGDYGWTVQPLYGV